MATLDLLNTRIKLLGPSLKVKRSDRQLAERRRRLAGRQSPKGHLSKNQGTYNELKNSWTPKVCN